jgi:hypothetical protein
MVDTIQEEVGWGSNGKMEGRLQDVRLSGEEDEVRPALEKSGCFSSRSLYHFLSSGEVRSRRMEKI